MMIETLRVSPRWFRQSYAASKNQAREAFKKIASHLTAGKEEQQRITESARKEAAEIIASAEKKSREIIDEAEKKVAQLESNAQTSIAQASRDMIEATRTAVLKYLKTVFR